jgi:hypothetical protein
MLGPGSFPLAVIHRPMCASPTTRGFNKRGHVPAVQQPQGREGALYLRNEYVVRSHPRRR